MQSASTGSGGLGAPLRFGGPQLPWPALWCQFTCGAGSLSTSDPWPPQPPFGFLLYPENKPEQLIQGGIDMIFMETIKHL